MDNRTLEEVRKNETKLIEEIKSLEKQLKYLRSGEYYNQLRFERDMLQQVVDTNGVPSEVYDYIDCTHRNTELLKENQRLKDRDLIIAAELTKLQDENKQLKEELVSANESITWWNNRFNAVTRDNKHLKDNWNKLKDYIKETKLKEFEKAYGKRYGKTFTQAEIVVCNMILDKIQELEKGSDK